MYEAIHHAAHRHLYGMTVTDFRMSNACSPMPTCALVAMKLVALRAADYMRSATPEDRRYLLYNPVVKMKVTTQGEDVIDHLWDVIAAKGFEKDLFFEMAARDIRALPKLEGTVHVNIALIVKFMKNYFFAPVELSEVPRRDDAANDSFLFDQGPTKGLGYIQFHDYAQIFERFDLPNVRLFAEQAEVFKSMLATAAPTEAQTKDTQIGSWLWARYSPLWCTHSSCLRTRRSMASTVTLWMRSSMLWSVTCPGLQSSSMASRRPRSSRVNSAKR